MKISRIVFFTLIVSLSSLLFSSLFSPISEAKVSIPASDSCTQEYLGVAFVVPFSAYSKNKHKKATMRKLKERLIKKNCIDKVRTEYNPSSDECLEASSGLAEYFKPIEFFYSDREESIAINVRSVNLSKKILKQESKTLKRKRSKKQRIKASKNKINKTKKIKKVNKEIKRTLLRIKSQRRLLMVEISNVVDKSSFSAPRYSLLIDNLVSSGCVRENFKVGNAADNKVEQELNKHKRLNISTNMLNNMIGLRILRRV